MTTPKGLVSSTDWAAIHSRIQHLTFDKVLDTQNRSQINKMFRNISNLVTELSKIEVEARRNRLVFKRDELVIRINNNIQLIEEFILVAALIG
jgi:hypothetical protein